MTRVIGIIMVVAGVMMLLGAMVRPRATSIIDLCGVSVAGVCSC